MIMMALFRFLRPFGQLFLLPLQTFLVSHFFASSAGLEVSLISAQNYLWCFSVVLSSQGSFSLFSSLIRCVSLLLRLFSFPCFDFQVVKACWVEVPPFSLFRSFSFSVA